MASENIILLVFWTFKINGPISSDCFICKSSFKSCLMDNTIRLSLRLRSIRGLKTRRSSAPSMPKHILIYIFSSLLETNLVGHKQQQQSSKRHCNSKGTILHRHPGPRLERCQSHLPIRHQGSGCRGATWSMGPQRIVSRREWGDLLSVSAKWTSLAFFLLLFRGVISSNSSRRRSAINRQSQMIKDTPLSLEIEKVGVHSKFLLRFVL